MNIEFNWIAILTATIAGTVVAGIWYSKLFGKSWRELTGVTEADSKKAGKTPILILVVSNFITTLGMGFILNQLQPESDLSKFIFSILMLSVIRFTVILYKLALSIVHCKSTPFPPSL